MKSPRAESAKRRRVAMGRLTPGAAGSILFNALPEKEVRKFTGRNLRTCCGVSGRGLTVFGGLLEHTAATLNQKTKLRKP